MEKAKDWATSGGAKMAQNRIFQKRPIFIQDHFGVTLKSFWGHFGLIWGAEGHFGVIWGRLGVILWSNWGATESFWGHFGIIFGSF
jgi:hypothetical protein